MKRTSLFIKILSVAFAAAIAFTVSVREVHYLFAQHEAHEHCENHLHQTDYHKDCSVCKFDISVFSDDILPNENLAAIAFTNKFHVNFQSLKLQSSIFNYALRGPPSLA